MAPILHHTLRGVASAVPPALESRTDGLGSAGGPLHEARGLLMARDRVVPSVDPGAGSMDPHDINNAGFFALFALIGVACVAVGIWFFFWAKNGGFHFKENDWDDYKTTVLRRRGPNGTVLSGATESTDLGGGSVYKDVDDDDTTTVLTESTGMTGITAGASDIFAREKRKQKKEKRDRERAKKREAAEGKRRSKRVVGEDGVEDQDAEKSAKKELRSYRHEKPARVGGLNKESEGSTWDGSTNPSDSTVSSELLPNRETTPVASPTTTPKKAHMAAGGIRKVYSVADRRDQRENERLRADSRRQREENRIVRRDFSYQRPGAESSVATESLLEGTSVTASSTAGTSDLGTKSYHHPMPELRELERERNREEREREREERRLRRGGYRRGRTDEH